MGFLLVRVKLSSAVVTSKPLSLGGFTHQIQAKSDSIQVVGDFEAKSSGIWPLMLLCRERVMENSPGFYLFQPRSDTCHFLSPNPLMRTSQLALTQPSEKCKTAHEWLLNTNCL